MTLHASPLTLDTLAALRQALADSCWHLEAFFLEKADAPRPDATTLGPSVPCPFGLGSRAWLRRLDGEDPDGIGTFAVWIEITPGWRVVGTLLCKGKLSFVERPIAPPRRWSEATLEAIQTLLDPSDGFFGFHVEGPGVAPKGHAQPCDRGVVSKEWVDQSSGFSGDDFSGTVSWPMAGRLVVGSFCC